MQYLWPYGFSGMAKGDLRQFLPRRVPIDFFGALGSPWSENFMQRLRASMGKEGAQIRGGS